MGLDLKGGALTDNPRPTHSQTGTQRGGGNKNHKSSTMLLMAAYLQDKDVASKMPQKDQ